MKKKYICTLLVLLIFGSSLTAVAGGAPKTADLRADHATAKATLNCDFRIRLIGNDSADASTKLNETNTHYRVAVRLEGCDSRGNLIDFKYNSNSSVAKSGTLSLSDVASFRSRHSIDEFDSNYNYVEVEALPLFEHE